VVPTRWSPEPARSASASSQVRASNPEQRAERASVRTSCRDGSGDPGNGMLEPFLLGLTCDPLRARRTPSQRWRAIVSGAFLPRPEPAGGRKDEETAVRA
jgi:hypothetical protein